jgi:hypothetical protein
VEFKNLSQILSGESIWARKWGKEDNCQLGQGGKLQLRAANHCTCFCDVWMVGVRLKVRENIVAQQASTMFSPDSPDHFHLLLSIVVMYN